MEPNGSNLPATYDDAVSLLGSLEDHRTLTMGESINSSVTSFSVVGTFGFEAPTYFLFTDGTDEIIHVGTVTVDLSGVQATFSGVTRGARGTTAQAHSGDATLVAVLTGRHLMQFRDALLAAEKYQALVVASLPGAPLPGEVAIYAGNVYFCVTAGLWQRVSLPDHDLLSNLSVGDPHTNLHNNARASTWHAGLSGGHVYGGDSHDHSVGAGVGRLRSGAGSSRPSPSAAGEVYYASDTKLLSVSLSAGSWKVITGAPVGAIAMFDEAAIAAHGGSCPQGWSRFTLLDSRFPIGADPAHTTQGSLVNAGNDAHTHTYNQVAAHTHVIPQVAVTTNSTTNHTHSIPEAGGSSGDSVYKVGSAVPGGTSVGTAGSHTHAVTFAAHTTLVTKKAADNSDGAASGTSSSSDTRPPYKTFIFCKKD